MEIDDEGEWSLPSRTAAQEEAHAALGYGGDGPVDGGDGRDRDDGPVDGGDGCGDEGRCCGGGGGGGGDELWAEQSPWPRRASAAVGVRGRFLGAAMALLLLQLAFVAATFSAPWAEGEAGEVGGGGAPARYRLYLTYVRWGNATLRYHDPRLTLAGVVRCAAPAGLAAAVRAALGFEVATAVALAFAYAALTDVRLCPVRPRPPSPLALSRPASCVCRPRGDGGGRRLPRCAAAATSCLAVNGFGCMVCALASVWVFFACAALPARLTLLGGVWLALATSGVAAANVALGVCFYKCERPRRGG